MAVPVYDIIIQGAGFIGKFLACVLGSQDLNILLMDANAQVLEDQRSFALSWGSYCFLEKHLGNLGDIAHPIEKVEISQENDPAELIYTAQEVGFPALGFMVPAAELRNILELRLNTISSIHQRISDQCLSWFEEHNKLKVTLASGETVAGDLLVGADGKDSTLRRLLGVPLYHHPYAHHGLVTILQHERDHDNTACQYFTPEGPLALLPLKNQQTGIVWSMEKERVESLCAHPEAFIEALRGHLKRDLGNITLSAPLQSFPLKLSMPYRIHDERIVLLGDAAHAFHPVTGQGLNVGIRDVAVLENLFVSYKRLGLELGGTEMVRTYEKRRMLDRWSMAGLTHSCGGEMFSHDFFPVLRGVAFQWITRMPWLKQQWIRHAMGLSVPGFTSEQGFYGEGESGHV